MYESAVAPWPHCLFPPLATGSFSFQSLLLTRTLRLPAYPSSQRCPLPAQATGRAQPAVPLLIRNIPCACPFLSASTIRPSRSQLREACGRDCIYSSCWARRGAPIRGHLTLRGWHHAASPPNQACEKEGKKKKNNACVWVDESQARGGDAV